MKIFYVGMQYDHYDPRNGPSFEHENFYSSLTHFPGAEVRYFPFERILVVGKKRFNEEILEAAERERPELMFAFMYSDEFDPATLSRLREYTKTMAWFADDYWRFFNYSQRWAPHFTYAVTTYARAMGWYGQAGVAHALLSQWGCNPAISKPLELAKDIEVSFVGMKKSGRARIVDSLQTAGIRVECFGTGWPNERIAQEEKLRIFSRSKICLNLTDRKSLWDPSAIARIFMKKSLNRLVPDFHLIDNFRAWRHFVTPHTHARPFELAGCGAFTISGWSEDIGQYYKEDQEMVFYRNAADLAEKIKYYLAHDAEREAIARAGYLRTMKEHTYESRFKKLFAEIGVPA